MKLTHRTWLVGGASFGRSAAVPSIRSRSAETEKVTQMSDETFPPTENVQINRIKQINRS